MFIEQKGSNHYLPNELRTYLVDGKLSGTKYPPEELKALKKSFEVKWSEIVNGFGVDELSENCPLCSIHGCDDCCIRVETGRDGCRSTPYASWSQYFSSHGYYRGKRRVISAESYGLALNEYNFLKSLHKVLTAEASREEKKHYITIENPETAIGDGLIRIGVSDSPMGRIISGHYIYGVGSDGVAVKYAGIGDDTKLQLDSYGYIKER